MVNPVDYVSFGGDDAEDTEVGDLTGSSEASRLTSGSGFAILSSVASSALRASSLSSR